MRLFLFLIFVLSITAYAKTPLEIKQDAEISLKLSQQVHDLAQNQQELAETELKRQTNFVEETHKYIQHEQQFLKENEKKYAGKKGGFLGFFESNLSDDFVKEYESRKNRLKMLEQSRNKQIETLEGLQKKLDTAIDNVDTKADYVGSAGSKFDEAQRNLEQARSEMQEDMMNVSHLTLKHEIVGAKLATVGLELDVLKNKYDNSMLGAYMRDRVLKLLNSKVFCDKAIACTSGENPAVIDSDLNSVFPGFFAHPTERARPSSPVGATTTK